MRTYVDIPDSINYDWLMVQKYNKDGLLYKVIDNINENIPNDDVERIKYKPFLQIEMEQNGEKTEIQENLNFFFCRRK